MRGIHINMLSPVRIHETTRINNKEPNEPPNNIENSQMLKISGNSEYNNGADNNMINDHQPRLKNNKDELDRPHKSATVTRWDVIFLSFSIITHIIDIGADIALAVRYLILTEYTYFIWTIVFIIVPTFANTFISFRMNDNDLKVGMTSQDENERKRRMRTATTAAAQRKAFCIFVLFFQLAPVLRYCDSLRYALKARQCKRRGDREGQERYYLKMLKEDQDVALLRVFECFLESAPQQILQLTILLTHERRKDWLLVHQILSICSSLVSMGWSMASYHRAIRLAQHNKPNISITGTVLQFLWHFCVTVSRILAITVLANICPIYTGLACGLHWIAMTTWLVKEPHGVADFCRDGQNPPYTPLTICERFRTALFAAVLGTVYVFTYLNPSEGRTFVRHLFYYALCSIENAAAAILWAMYVDSGVKEQWYFELLLTLCTVPFCIGISSMILYYMFFHPTTKRKNNNISLEQVSSPS